MVPGQRATALMSVADPDRPVHVGVLLGNTPDMLVQMASAGLGGYVLCGLNSTRRGDALAADIRRSDCQILVTDPHHRPLLAGLDLDGIRLFDTSTPEWQDLIGDVANEEFVPHRQVAPLDTFMMIFTSGTSGNPKAVQVSHFMALAAGMTLAQRFSLSQDDTCYVSMPLFHSNAVVAGWAPAVSAGAAVAPAKFSASNFLDDVRRYGATYMNYVGKPLSYILATNERPDDADNTLRVAFGNEANENDIGEFARRFEVLVEDGFGSTENAVHVIREPGTPSGSIGKGAPGVAIYDSETITECPAARFDDSGQLINPDQAIGELVNTTGGGYFTGYYNDPEANADRMRHGFYWSGDLAYRDEQGWIYLAGRTADWMRVDGENVTTAPIERILLRHPAIDRCGGVRGARRARRRPDHGGHRAQRSDRPADGRSLGLPCSPIRSVPQVLAAIRPHHRGVADDSDVQDRSNANSSPRAPWPGRGCCGFVNCGEPNTTRRNVRCETPASPDDARPAGVADDSMPREHGTDVVGTRPSMTPPCRSQRRKDPESSRDFRMVRR